MSEDLFIILFIIVVAGLALIIPYIIDYIINLFPPRKGRLNTKINKRNSRQEFYSAEFETEEIYEPTEIKSDSEEEFDSFSRNIYICPECGSLKLRMSKVGMITCADCGRDFAIDGDVNTNLH